MSEFDVRSLTGSTVVDTAGERIGEVVDVYLDDATQLPRWVTVRAGAAETFVPLAGARVRDGALVVDVTRDQVAGAPRTAADGHLSPADEEEIHRYYGSGAMTRSEEHLVAGTREVEATLVKLRKYVVTEMVTVQVPVRREEVRLEHEPIPAAGPGGSVTEVTDGTDGTDGTDAGTDDEIEMILHAERPVVTTETVPVERVRIGKQTVTGTETVTGEVRREEIELEEPR